MFCPNCGSKNDDKQNYCRFCGLNIQASAKSLMDQIVFGKDSDSLKKLRTFKRTVDVASTILIGALIAGVVADIFLVIEWSDKLMKISLGLLILFQVVQGIVGISLEKTGANLEPNSSGRITLSVLKHRSAPSFWRNRHLSRYRASLRTRRSYFQPKMKRADCKIPRTKQWASRRES